MFNLLESIFTDCFNIIRLPTNFVIVPNCKDYGKIPSRFPIMKWFAFSVQGGMGTVMLARHAQTGRLVAIKTLLPEVAVSEQSLKRFLREKEVAVSLRHPHIVGYIEHGTQRCCLPCFRICRRNGCFKTFEATRRKIKLQGSRRNYWTNSCSSRFCALSGICSPRHQGTKHFSWWKFSALQC